MTYRNHPMKAAARPTGRLRMSTYHTGLPDRFHQSTGLILTLVLLIAGLPAVAGCTSASRTNVSAADSATLHVMSFNIRYNTPDDAENAWPHRKDAVASVIRFHETDLAGLQEAQFDQIQDLEARLPGYAWIGVGRDDGESAGEFTPIFYREDRFELEEGDTFWLSETPTVTGSKSWDAAITRIATWGIFRDRRTGSRFVMLNTHFDHIGTEARLESARIIVDRVAEFDLPVVVTGDFNTTPDTDAYAVLTSENSGLRDAFNASDIPHHGPTSTWNGFEAVRPDRRIDFIFVSDDVSVIRHGILSETIDGRFPSDHLPVLSEIRLDR